jgi:GNAT superfamily N-acetyltransferase
VIKLRGDLVQAREQRLTCNLKCKAPDSCSDHELADFAHLVREGFEGSDAGLPGRIRKARRLAFHYVSGSELVAIAALKAPDGRERASLFGMAGAPTDAEHELELGWVFVYPRYRGRRIARTLCELVLAHAPGTGIYATTRPDNEPMKRTLSMLSFVQAGKPFPHRRRDEELLLFLRPGGRALPAAQ